MISPWQSGGGEGLNGGNPGQLTCILLFVSHNIRI